MDGKSTDRRDGAPIIEIVEETEARSFAEELRHLAQRGFGELLAGDLSVEPLCFGIGDLGVWTELVSDETTSSHFPRAPFTPHLASKRKKSH